MKKKITLIHTGFVLVPILKDIFTRSSQLVELTNVVDDSLLREVIANGKVEKSVVKRMCSYMLNAEESGADIILNVCSSVSEVVDTARNMVGIPIMKIDEAMAETAVQAGTNIGVIATLATTLNPTCRLLERKNQQGNEKLNIRKDLCPGAFNKLISGDSRGHDEIVIERIIKMAEKVDVIVLAQGSMARLAPLVEKEISIPVLSSLESGVKRTIEILLENKS